MIANCLPDSEKTTVNQEETSELCQIPEEFHGDISQHGNPVSQQDLRIWANSKREFD